MGRAPYKFAKEGDGHSFTFITTKERPRHVYSDLLPSKQTIGQTTETPAASKLSPDGTQHSEQHHVAVSMAGVAHSVHRISYVFQ